MFYRTLPFIVTALKS